MISSFIRRTFFKKEMVKFQSVYDEWNKSFETKTEIENELSKVYNDVINFNLIHDINMNRETMLNTPRRFGPLIYIRRLFYLNHNVRLFMILII